MGAAPVSRYLCDKWLREAERLAGVEKLDGRLWHAYRAKFAKGKLLTGFCWDFFSTVTFKDPVSFDFADRAVERFVRSLDDTAYAFHGLERGRVGEHVHSHVLLGGIKPRRQRNVIWKEWPHGDVRYELYDPARGAAWYVSKHFRLSEWGGFVGAEPVRVRRRRRG